MTQNYCLSNAKHEWICFINSGDILLESARVVIQRTMILGTNYSIFVFGQYFSFSYFSTLASFIPSSLSLWPHQSIVTKKHCIVNMAIIMLPLGTVLTRYSLPM